MHVWRPSDQFSIKMGFFRTLCCGCFGFKTYKSSASDDAWLDKMVDANRVATPPRSPPATVAREKALDKAAKQNVKTWLEKEAKGAPESYEIPFLQADLIPATNTTRSLPATSRKPVIPWNSTRSAPPVSKVGGIAQVYSQIWEGDKGCPPLVWTHAWHPKHQNIRRRALPTHLALDQRLPGS